MSGRVFPIVAALTSAQQIVIAHNTYGTNDAITTLRARISQQSWKATIPKEAVRKNCTATASSRGPDTGSRSAMRGRIVPVFVERR